MRLLFYCDRTRQKGVGLLLRLVGGGALEKNKLTKYYSFPYTIFYKYLCNALGIWRSKEVIDLQELTVSRRSMRVHAKTREM